jgi:hypothetical protein
LREKSLNQQLDALILLGNKNGLHDAADWLRAQVDQARLIFNVERERAEQLSFLNRFQGEALSSPQLREKLIAMFPALTTPKAHAITMKWLNENGRPDTVKGVLVS